MRKIAQSLPALGLALILLVTACKPGTGTPEPTTPPTTAPTTPPTAVAGTAEGLATPVIGDPNEPVTVVTPEVPGVCTASPLPQLPVRAVDDTDHVKGASIADADLVLYEYSDFQCPGCGGMYPIVEMFVEQNPNVALVYRHFPLDFHALAPITAEASEAAGAQGKFWEMHDLLFDNTAQWSTLTVETIRPVLTSYAQTLQLDVDAFNAALDGGTYTEKVKSQYNEGLELGLPGTPSFIFDNVLFPSDIGLSLQGLQAFLSIIEKQDEIFYSEPPAVTVAAEDIYEAVLKTSKGDIRVNLLAASAPANVNSFVFLAQEKWYDGADFFYVRDNFVAVTGDPTNSTVGYPGYTCEGEAQGTFDRAGLVGMLSNGQFFITLGAEAAQLTGQFSLIGQVVEGLEVLDSLARRAVGDPAAPVADVLETIEIIAK
ncbi:MAG: peptidylprolyl isomerase [Anaerolineae bacterium]|nr:peptidylprolyl isomerase [Anaerolineae bacterium]